MKLNERDLLWVAIGGAIGAVVRFLLSGWVQNLVALSFFPLGTWIVNLIGSFLLGLIMYVAESGGMLSHELRIFLSIGLLGSFTTFSTLGYESFRMLEEKEYVYFLLNSGGSFGAALFSIFLSKMIVSLLWR